MRTLIRLLALFGATLAHGQQIIVPRPPVTRLEMGIDVPNGTIP